MMIAMWGDRHPMPAGFVAGFVVFVFSYLVFKRLRASPPAYGVHECSNCRKVIYSESCPYCYPLSQDELKKRSNPSLGMWRLNAIRPIASKCLKPSADGFEYHLEIGRIRIFDGIRPSVAHRCAPAAR